MSPCYKSLDQAVSNYDTKIHAVAKPTPITGRAEFQLGLMRHSKKDGDKLTEEGIEYAKQKGAQYLGGYDGDIVRIDHSRYHRTAQTGLAVAEGAGIKNPHIKQDSRLWTFSDEESDDMEAKIKAMGKKEYMDAAIQEKDAYFKDVYNRLANPIISYIKETIRYNVKKLQDGDKKRIQAVSHSFILDSSLAKLLQLNDEEINSVGDIGGIFDECDQYLITVTKDGDGIKMKVDYKGGSKEIDLESLGLDEAELSALEAEIESMEAEGGEGEAAEAA